MIDRFSPAGTCRQPTFGNLVATVVVCLLVVAAVAIAFGS